MDTWDLMPFVRKRWKTILEVTAVVVLTTMAVTLVLAPVYQSMATLWVQPLTFDQPLPAPLTMQLGTKAAAELIKSPNVTRRAAKALGVSKSGLGGTIEYRVAEDTNLLEISVEADNPERAAKVANAVGQAYIDENVSVLAAQSVQIEKLLQDKLAALKRQDALLRKELGAARAAGNATQVATLQDRISTSQISYQDVQEDLQALPANEMKMAAVFAFADKAVPNTSPVRPRPALNLILSLVGGLLVGLAVARVLEGMQESKLRKRHEARQEPDE